MPRIASGDDMQQVALPSSHYGFSTIRMEDLEKLGNEWTLVQLTADASGSTDPFKRTMEATIGNVIRACQKSPRADYLLIRVVSFDTMINEVHGFKPLVNCKPDDYMGCLGDRGGRTALYQVALNGAEALLKQSDAMTQNNFTVNAIDVVITDGMDTEGGATPSQVAKVRGRAVAEETLESMVSILVGVNVNDSQVASFLKRFETEAGFTQYVEVDNANEKTLAKLAEFVSKSISSQSQSLGTGGPSQALNF